MVVTLTMQQILDAQLMPSSSLFLVFNFNSIPTIFFTDANSIMNLNGIPRDLSLIPM